jgi:hypothetical protein
MTSVNQECARWRGQQLDGQLLLAKMIKLIVRGTKESTVQMNQWVDT